MYASSPKCSLPFGFCYYIQFLYDMIYLLTAVGSTPGGSSTVHIYTETVHRTTQLTNWEECGPCSVLAIYIPAFALQPRKKHGKTTVRVAASKNTWKTISIHRQR